MSNSYPSSSPSTDGFNASVSTTKEDSAKDDGTASPPSGPMRTTNAFSSMTSLSSWVDDDGIDSDSMDCGVREEGVVFDEESDEEEEEEEEGGEDTKVHKEEK